MKKKRGRNDEQLISFVIKNNIGHIKMCEVECTTVGMHKNKLANILSWGRDQAHKKRTETKKSHQVNRIPNRTHNQLKLLIQKKTSQKKNFYSRSKFNCVAMLLSLSVVGALFSFHPVKNHIRLWSVPCITKKKKNLRSNWAFFLHFVVVVVNSSIFSRLVIAVATASLSVLQVYEVSFPFSMMCK